MGLWYYIGPWRWVDDDEGQRWEAPEGTVGLVDLRPLVNVESTGFFATDAPLADSNYTLLNDGTHLAEYHPGAGARSAWESMLGVTPQLSGTLLDWLWDTLTIDADPDGGDRAKPIIPTHKGYLELHLGGHSLVRSERMPESPDTAWHWTQLQAVLRNSYRAIRDHAVAEADVIASLTQADLTSADPYRRSLARRIYALAQNRSWTLLQARNFAEGYTRRVPRRWLGAQAKKYLGRRFRWVKQRIQEEGWPLIRDWLTDDGALPEEPSTTIGDTFVDSHGTPIDEHTASGPNGGWSWTQWGTPYINSAGSYGFFGSGEYARAEHDLSSDDQYCQAYTQKDSYRRQGPAVRWNPVAANTWYCVGIFPSEVLVYKNVSGATTEILSASMTTGIDVLLYIEADGSSIRCHFNGTDAGPVSDTSITGYLRTGLAEWSGTTQEFADFEAGDLVSTPDPATVVGAGQVAAVRAAAVMGVIAGATGASRTKDVQTAGDAAVSVGASGAGRTWKVQALGDGAVLVSSSGVGRVFSPQEAADIAALVSGSVAAQTRRSEAIAALSALVGAAGAGSVQAVQTSAAVEALLGVIAASGASRVWASQTSSALTVAIGASGSAQVWDSRTSGAASVSISASGASELAHSQTSAAVAVLLGAIGVVGASRLWRVQTTSAASVLASGLGAGQVKTPNASGAIGALISSLGATELARIQTTGASRIIVGTEAVIKGRVWAPQTVGTITVPVSASGISSTWTFQTTGALAQLYAKFGTRYYATSDLDDFQYEYCRAFITQKFAQPDPGYQLHQVVLSHDGLTITHQDQITRTPTSGTIELRVLGYPGDANLYWSGYRFPYSQAVYVTSAGVLDPVYVTSWVQEELSKIPGELTMTFMICRPEEWYWPHEGKDPIPAYKVTTPNLRFGYLGDANNPADDVEDLRGGVIADPMFLSSYVILDEEDETVRRDQFYEGVLHGIGSGLR